MLFGVGLLAFYGFAIYKNGAIMDSIWRLYVGTPIYITGFESSPRFGCSYGEEKNFFLPFDTEIDGTTLSLLIDKSQK